MTQLEQWDATIRFYEKLLDITWEVYTEIGRLSDCAAAQTFPQDEQRQALIRLSMDWQERSAPVTVLDGETASTHYPVNLDEIAVHELLHLIDHDRQTTHEDIVEHAGEVGKALDGIHFMQWERALNDVARAIARAVPSCV